MLCGVWPDLNDFQTTQLSPVTFTFVKFPLSHLYFLSSLLDRTHAEARLQQLLRPINITSTTQVVAVTVVLDQSPPPAVTQQLAAAGPQV